MSRERGITLALPTRELILKRPLIMGILNINDDSFSGDGSLDPKAAIARAKEILAQGGDIVDVGAESARTNRAPITEEEEIRRLRPFLAQWPEIVGSMNPRDPEQIWPPILSVNTWRPRVIAAALEMGAELINDMGGLAEEENARLCAFARGALLIMHTVGLPKQAHDHIRHADVLESVEKFFAEKIDRARQAGLRDEQIVLDPGLGFAKQPGDDLRLCAHAGRLKKFARPVLLPISRKGFLGTVVGEADAAKRDAASIGAIGALGQTATELPFIFRMHNIEAARQALRVLLAVFGEADA